MTNVLFSHSYFMRFDPKQWATAQPYAPLGTLYAAAWVRERGYSVALHDTMFSNDADSVIDSIRQHRPDIFVLCDDGFNYLTKMCLTNMREAAFRMIHIAKQSGCIVIVSSSDATDHFQQYLDKGADFIVLGEVEHTLTELLDALRDQAKEFTAIPGLAYQRNGTTLKTLKRNVIRDLDSLPMPAWDLIDIQLYRDMWMKSSGYFSINLATTRGCPYKCNWCAKPIYGSRYNSRSPEKVVQEIQYLQAKFHMDHIWFCDDIFGLKPGWVENFADILYRNGLRVPFKIQARADLLANEKYTRSLAVAGCDNVWMGAESGSQKILDAMDKGIEVVQITAASTLLKKYGIKPSFFLQFGYPGETKDDIEHTVSMVNQLLPHSIGISVSYPLPGTLFYEKVKSELTQKANWTDSDELALMFKNTFPPAFYRQLHRYVHRSHRLHTGLHYIRSIMQHPMKNGRHALKKAISVVYYLPAMLLSRQKLDKLARS